MCWVIEPSPAVSPPPRPCLALESEETKPNVPSAFIGHVFLGISFHATCLSFLFLSCKMRTPASERS